MPSDQYIPRTCDILDRACDALGSAYRLQDDASAGQLERLIRNLPGATLCWQLGTLLLTSPSGHTYRVSRAGCDCPNGQAGRRQCWHLIVHELLLDMFSTEAESRDIDADPPGENPLGDDEGDEPPEAHVAPWRIGALARARQLQTRLAATSQYLDTLRAEQARVGLPAQPAKPLRVRLVEARKRSPYFLSAFYLSKAA